MIPSNLTGPVARYALAVVVGASVALWVRGTIADAAEARMAAASSQQLEEWTNAANDALQAALAVSAQRIETLEKTVEESNTRTAQATADAAGAVADAARLRKRVGALSADIARFDPALANGSSARPGSADLLAYMLGRLIDRATALAAVADGARNAGLTCERAYDSLSGR